MDLTTSTTPSPNTTTKTADTETDTPPPATQPIKPLSFANGALKRHHPHRHHHHHPLQAPPAVVVSYKECLKNHAASLGGHALDGCGEFMPSPTATPTDPTSIKCAACGCHRNFHRREPDDPTAHHVLELYHHHRNRTTHPPPSHPRSSNSPSPPPPPPSPPPPSSYYSSAPHMLLALSTGVPGPSDEHPMVNPTAAMKTENPSGRKRFRTKFSQEQKEKMQCFSERLGWKMQKSDEGLVEEFCTEVGVSKGVLKVWMHNNKHTYGKRDVDSSNHNISNTRIDFDTNGHSNNHTHHNEATSDHLHVSTNGSSSSS